MLHLVCKSDTNTLSLDGQEPTGDSFIAQRPSNDRQVYHCIQHFISLVTVIHFAVNVPLGSILQKGLHPCYKQMIYCCMYQRPLWSSEHHNHHPCRNNLKSQWVSTGDPVGNTISISGAQTTLFPQSSFSERETSSLDVCVDRGMSSVLLQDPISVVLPQEVTDQDCAVP